MANSECFLHAENLTLFNNVMGGLIFTKVNGLESIEHSAWPARTIYYLCVVL